MYTYHVFITALVVLRDFHNRDLLLYVKGAIIKTYEGVDASLQAFLTSALDGGDCSASVFFISGG
jgi:hypothetical protein